MEELVEKVRHLERLYHAVLDAAIEEHDIEKVGARLRGLMPWIKKRSIKGSQASYS